MINTIFYFTDSLPYETYQTKIDKDSDDGIASKTIVFAKQQGKIYNNGFSYGITQSEIQQLINASVATSQGKLENDDAVIREALTTLSGDLSGAKGRISTAEQAITTLQNTLSTTQGNLSNYVTLDTDQELTGEKLFRGANQFTFNNLSKDGVLVQSGTNSVNVKQSRITSQQITTPKIVVTGQPSDNVLLAGGSSLSLSEQGYASGSAVQDGFEDVYEQLDDKLSLSTGGTVDGDITADSFIKTGSSNNYVLLGGGGHKLLSEITPASPGTTVVHEDYDDTELRGLIANLDNAIDSVSATADDTAGDLSDLLTNLDNSIKTKVESLLDDAAWVQNNFPAGTTGSASNFGQSDVESYLQTIGVWEQNEAHTASTTKWSELSQSVDGIASRVTQLEGATATGGNVNYSLLSSSLYAYIHDHYADSGVESTWGKFGQLTTGDIQMIQWMSSGMNAQASDSTSVANLFAAAKDYQTNQSAIADAKALVTRDGNDNLTATSYMTAMVDQAIGGIRSDVGGNYASTTVFNKIDDDEDILSALVTKVTGDGSSVSSSADILAKVNNMSAGVVTTATLDNATASLITNNASSGLKTAVMGKIDTAINTAKLDLVAANDYNAASIVAMVNASNDSSIKLSADKITLDGQTVASSIRANDITLTGQVQADNFQAGSGSGVNIKTTGSTISFCDGATEKARFVLEGSGLQLYIMDENGNWRKINWSNWTDVNATSYTPVTVYKIVNGSFDQSVVYFQNGTWYTAPNTSSGTPSGTFYIKVNPAYLESDSSVYFDYSTPVIYAPVPLTVYVDGSIDSTETIAMPIYEYDIDVYIEVTLSNSGVVETNNKIYTTSNFPEHASIERDGYGAIHSSRVYYGSTLKYIIPSNVSTSSIGWKYINNDMKTVNGTTVTVTDSSLVEAESNINGANVVQTQKYTFEDYDA